MNVSRPGPQRGIALITALLIVSLATIAATALLGYNYRAIHRTNSMLQTEQAGWYAVGVEAWAATLLQQDLEQNNIDALNDIWAQPVDYLPVETGFLSGQIVDLQGRFNLNNLGIANLDQYQLYANQLERLMASIEGLDPFLARTLAPSIRDWIDTDQEQTPYDGAEDPEYARLTPPYRTANRLMQSVTELMAIKGMTREVYQRLLPHVAALPQTGTAINVNTATPPVLHAMFENPTAALDSFIEQRLSKPAESVSELTQQMDAGDTPDSMFTVRSSFFQLQTVATIGNSRVALYSLYFRPSTGAPTVLAHSTDSP